MPTREFRELIEAMPVDRQRRTVDRAGFFADGGCDDRLDDSDDAEEEGNEPEARFKVAADRCGEKGDEDENEPSYNPHGSEQKEADEKQSDGDAVADKKQ